MTRLLALVLVAINFAIARRLFSTEFTQHTGSNEGTFMAISRFLAERGFHFGWFPLWFNGVPFENTYSPALQIADALLMRLLHWSPGLAFHFTIALFYCLGPAFLFLFAVKLSGDRWLSFMAALFYSLFSPSVLFPAVRADVGGWFNARRLHTLVHYGEGAHNVALSLLPLALLLAYLAMTRRLYRWKAAAGIMTGLMVLINAFAAVDLAIGFVILCVIQPVGARVRSLALMGAIGACAYVWICPFLTPTLIKTIRTDSMLGGGYHYTPRVIATALFIVAGAVGIWLGTRRLNTLERFALPFAWIMFAIPAFGHFAHIAVLPQPDRYHLEMEMGFTLALFTLGRRLLRRAGNVRTAAVAGCVVGLLIAQFIVYRKFARELIERLDITTTVEYKTPKWMEANLPGLRAMVSGDLGPWFNAFTDNPQLSAGHDPFSPNWMIQIATYAIYASDDAPKSILWLQAFGCHAINVPGQQSRELYKPYRFPGKFEGVLPVLWREGDDVIYGVPQRSKSLAHVVPDSAVVSHAPIHGLDTAEVERFVRAIEDPMLPEARLTWADPEHARIHAAVHPGQALAVQVTYDPGWIAKANGDPAIISRDGIGLLTVHPKCEGICEVSLEFEGGLERRVCRMASFGVTIGTLSFGIFRLISSKYGRAV